MANGQGRALTRRATLAAVAAGFGAAAFGSSAKAQAAPRTFVLVHGSWHGGWCWRRVSDRLEKLGHKVFAPTLTGLGERSHLLDEKVNLTTHITDVVNVIKWERLTNVVLCGHSYAGYPVSGALEQIGSAVSSIVYLDSFLPDNGDSILEKGNPRVAEAIQAAVEKKQLSLPPLPPRSFRSTRPIARGRQHVHAAAARHVHGEAGTERRARGHCQKDLYPRQGLRAADLRCGRREAEKRSDLACAARRERPRRHGRRTGPPGGDAARSDLISDYFAVIGASAQYENQAPRHSAIIRAEVAITAIARI